MLLGKEEQGTLSPSNPSHLKTSFIFSAIQAVVAMAKCSAENEDMLGLVSLVAQMAFEVHVFSNSVERL